MKNITIALPNGTTVCWEVSDADAEKLETKVQEVTGPVTVKIEEVAK